MLELRGHHGSVWLVPPMPELRRNGRLLVTPRPELVEMARKHYRCRVDEDSGSILHGDSCSFYQHRSGEPACASVASLLQSAVEGERESNLEWVRAFARDCGCAAKIEAAIISDPLNEWVAKNAVIRSTGAGKG